MPCDSPAAGLITLGAMVSDLENSESNDVTGHYEGLLRYAEQFLLSCKHCKLKSCNPAKKGCGYTTKATGKLKNIKKIYARKSFKVSDRTEVRKKILWLDTLPVHKCHTLASNILDYCSLYYLSAWKFPH